MSRLNDLMNALNPATDEDGYAVLQPEYDRIKEELAALRGFACLIIYNNLYGFLDENKDAAKMTIKLSAKEYKLIDADGNPAPLLTGKKE